MAIEGRLTKKEMIDRQSLFKQPAEPLVKPAGAAPSAQPCPSAAAALKVGRGEPGRATARTRGEGRHRRARSAHPPGRVCATAQKHPPHPAARPNCLRNDHGWVRARAVCDRSVPPLWFARVGLWRHVPAEVRGWGKLGAGWWRAAGTSPVPQHPDPTACGDGLVAPSAETNSCPLGRERAS